MHACILDCCLHELFMDIMTICHQSLNSSIKGTVQYTDVKSGCDTSEGPSLNPNSLSLKKILVLLSLQDMSSYVI